jgi:hypothetical protein
MPPTGTVPKSRPAAGSTRITGGATAWVLPVIGRSKLGVAGSVDSTRSTFISAWPVREGAQLTSTRAPSVVPGRRPWAASAGRLSGSTGSTTTVSSASGSTSRARSSSSATLPRAHVHQVEAHGLAQAHVDLAEGQRGHAGAHAARRAGLDLGRLEVRHGGDHGCPRGRLHDGDLEHRRGRVVRLDAHGAAVELRVARQVLHAEAQRLLGREQLGQGVRERESEVGRGRRATLAHQRHAADGERGRADRHRAHLVLDQAAQGGVAEVHALGLAPDGGRHRAHDLVAARAEEAQGEERSHAPDSELWPHLGSCPVFLGQRQGEDMVYGARPDATRPLAAAPRSGAREAPLGRVPRALPGRAGRARDLPGPGGDGHRGPGGGPHVHRGHHGPPPRPLAGHRRGPGRHLRGLAGRHDPHGLVHALPRRLRARCPGVLERREPEPVPPPAPARAPAHRGLGHRGRRCHPARAQDLVDGHQPPGRPRRPGAHLGRLRRGGAAASRGLRPPALRRVALPCARVAAAAHAGARHARRSLRGPALHRALGGPLRPARALARHPPATTCRPTRPSG